MLATAQSKICPFCGLPNDVPHETQQGCIDALHAEIARTRNLLETVKPVAGETSPPESEPTLEHLHEEACTRRS